MNDNDRCRFNWNIFPSTRLEAKSLSAPLGCLYSPFVKSEKHQVIPQAEGQPLACYSCGNYINPHIKLDRVNHMWWCPFCEKRSLLPSEYQIPPSNATVNEWPVELQQNSTTVDFNLPKDISNSAEDDLPYAYFLILDLYQHTDDIQSSPFQTVIDSLIRAIERLPLGSSVGLITFDEVVNVYSLTSETSVTFNRDRLLNKDLETDLTNDTNIDYQSFFNEKLVDSIIDRLDLKSSIRSSWKESLLIEKGFLVQVTSESKFKLITFLRSLKPKFSTTYKPARSSGLAILIGSIMLSKASYRHFMGKILFFNGGPCTNEPGCISKSNQHLRSHSDIYQMKTPNYQYASKFYTVLSYVANGLGMDTALNITKSVSAKLTDYNCSEDTPKWSIDIFAFALDQVGIYEMKCLSQNTSGSIYLYDSPLSPKFKESLLESCHPIHSNTRIKVDTSVDLKIHRIISNGFNLPPSFNGKLSTLYDSKISDTLTKFDSSLSKKHFTNQLAYNSVSEDFTIAIYFEMVTARSSIELKTNGTKEVYIQFSIKYWNLEEHRWKLRVTTIKKPTTLSIFANNAIVLNNSNTNKGITKLVNPQSLELTKKATIESFDQESFVVLLTRLLINKIDTSLGFDKFDDLIKLLDETLVKLLYHFCRDFVKENNTQTSNPFDHETPSLPKEFNLLPSLIYNLRKNPQLIRIINSSPDETSFNHFWFLKFSCKKSISVVEPRLYKVINNSLDRIDLDSNCLRYPPGDFLIMDSVFNIVIFFLADEQKKLKLHPTNNDNLITESDPSIAEPLELIYKHSEYTMGPISRIHITQTEHSQSRFLLSRLNSREKVLEVKLSNLSIAEESKKSFWDIFKKKDSKKPKSYDILKTDDMNLKQYYKAILTMVHNYRIEDET